MKSLITFEHSSLPIHSIDFIKTLKSVGLQIDFLMGKVLPEINDPFNFFRNNTNVIDNIINFNDYDIWFFDASSWDGEKTPYLDSLQNFKGILACINFEDGYHFFQNRLNDYLIDKTNVFINNALYVDRCRYDKRIRNKLMLTTSYLSNSQDFKNVSIPFKNKKNRSIFTGSLTGGSETGNKNEENCRINIPLKIINGGKEIIYNIHGYDPTKKDIFDSFNIEYKKPILSRSEFIDLYVQSKVILSLKGNGHTVNRFFEGQASNSLIFSTPFDRIVEFIGQGSSGKDYVEIQFSGDDVLEKLDYYLQNLDESEKIANQARLTWETFSKRDDDGFLPERVRHKIISDITFNTGIKF